MSALVQKPKVSRAKTINSEEVFEEIRTVTDNFTQRISNDKGNHKNHFLEFKGCITSIILRKKNHTLLNEILCRSVKPIFCEHGDKNTMSSLKAEIVIVPIDKAANNMAFICKHLYALTKELNLDFHLLNTSDDTYDFINIKTKNIIVK